ncbi:MAG: hypothetical protein BYD32DRAFT_411280 [Podila humilis]|nr:MAG: hypothetical protein BYD32DRAFT_411280 [Podila humilis]
MPIRCTRSKQARRLFFLLVLYLYPTRTEKSRIYQERECVCQPNPVSSLSTQGISDVPQNHNWRMKSQTCI